MPSTVGCEGREGLRAEEEVWWKEVHLGGQETTHRGLLLDCRGEGGHP